MSAGPGNGPDEPEDAIRQEQPPAQDLPSRPDAAEDALRERGRGRDMSGNAPLTVFAKGLADLRTGAGKSLAEVAKAAGYTESTMSKVTSTTVLCSEAALLAYVTALGADPGPWHAEWERLRGMTAAERIAVPGLPPDDEGAPAAGPGRSAEPPVPPVPPVPLPTSTPPTPGEPGEPGQAVTGTNTPPPPGPVEQEAEPAASGEPAQAAGSPAPPMPAEPAPQEEPTPPATPARHPRSWLRPVPAWPRRHPVPTALAAVTAAAVIAAVLWPVHDGSTGRSTAPPSTSPARSSPAAAPQPSTTPGQPGVASALPACSNPGTELILTASADASTVLGDLAGSYGSRQVGDQCLRVKVMTMNSGLAMQALRKGWPETGAPRPDVWSPASAVWLPLARQNAAPGTAAAALPAQDPPLIATTPLVVAMPEPMARALGWPDKRITWNDFADWARNPQNFWTQHQNPGWGDFLLGKTDPRYSTSGLNATIAAFASAGPLTPDGIATEAARTTVSRIEQSVVHYGDTSLTFLANLRRADDAGPAGSRPGYSYISAVTVEESAVVAYNRGLPCGTRSDDDGCQQKTPPKTKLVAFYPTDKTLSSDHPYITLTDIGAPKKTLADDFLTYLHSAPAQALFGDIGLRTHDAKPTTYINQDNGALPDAPLTPFPLPAPEVLDKILSAWPDLRKRANVLLVIDTSASMDQGKIDGIGLSKLELLKQVADKLVQGFADQDRVGLWTFSSADVLNGTSNHRALVDIGPVKDPYSGRTRRTALTDNIRAVRAGGGTALYETTAAAVKELRDHYDPNAINAVLVLTDGKNDNDGTAGPQVSIDQLTQQLTDPAQKTIRVFTIGYGIDPNKKDKDTTDAWTDLQTIARESKARAYHAEDPKTILDTLTNVISNF
ncbi:substrate-binding domain-containing protein [Kitasatospora sp. NPDC057692]|uniref:substrate-binding domain-containing protein n=1 Tax=Kitasatospora sp. NPDC057692 TaxID=3346215 RepID=UPI0036C1A9BE